MIATARLKYLGVSAQKTRLVIDLVRGKPVAVALSNLRYSRKLVARDLEKLLQSALANAQQKDPKLDVDRLVVAKATVDEGPPQKRARAVDGAHLSDPQEVFARVDRARRDGSQGGPSSGRGPEVIVGQKVHPYGFRIGFNKTWRSRWYASKKYAELLHEDLKLRKDLKKRLGHAGVSAIEIERAANKLKVNILTSRPGIIIGRKGSEVDRLKEDIRKRTQREVFINILEIDKPEIDAQLVSEAIAMQLEKRVAFRRAMRKAIESALRFGAKGIKVQVGGRLAGAEIARTERYLEGRLPLHTLRSEIDYGVAEARTTYGVIGVKVWINRGESREIRLADDARR